jgi:hypothetical protein
MSRYYPEPSNFYATQEHVANGHTLYLLNSLTHGAEPYLRSRQLSSYSRTSKNFMEPEGLLPCSQKPSTGPYLEPDRSNPYHPILSLQVTF